MRFRRFSVMAFASCLPTNPSSTILVQQLYSFDRFAWSQLSYIGTPTLDC